MDSQYTKAQRHEIYIKARALYKRRVKRLNYGGLCKTILDAMPSEPIGEFRGACLGLDFPELMKYAPAEGIPQYWWPLFDKESRLKAFDEMVEETKED